MRARLCFCIFFLSIAVLLIIVAATAAFDQRMILSPSRNPFQENPSSRSLIEQSYARKEIKLNPWAIVPNNGGSVRSGKGDDSDEIVLIASGD